jgi:hypothetical protein
MTTYESALGLAISLLRQGKRLPISLTAELREQGYDIIGSVYAIRPFHCQATGRTTGSNAWADVCLRLMPVNLRCGIEGPGIDLDQSKYLAPWAVYGCQFFGCIEV